MYLILIAAVINLLCHSVKGQDQNQNINYQDLPCRIEHNQLYCSSKGASYPDGSINKYVDDNKALLRRMFGEQQEKTVVQQTTVTIVTSYAQTSFVSSPFGNQFGQDPIFQTGQNSIKRVRRDVLEGTWDEIVEYSDEKEHLFNGTVKRDVEDIPDLNINNDGNKADVCDSKIEIVQPYWASNSNGKIRAILNNKQFEQAIHQEICSGKSTSRCSRDCSCEQKYKWHRLLSYDPNNDCAGVFMDWFLFPSCCVCKCNNNPFRG